DKANQGLVRISLSKEEFNLDRIKSFAQDNKTKVLEKGIKETREEINKIEEKLKKEKNHEEKQKLQRNLDSLKKNLRELTYIKKQIEEFLSKPEIKDITKYSPFIYYPLYLQLEGYSYLGFSLKANKRELIPEDTTFTLTIRFHPKSTDDDIKKFFCALWLAFNLGNFGSRSRRGFGSIKVEKIEENNKDLISNCFDLSFLPTPQIENWIKDNLEKIKNILNPKPRNGIPYLFEHFEVYKYEEKNDWKNLMDQAGSEYKKFRQSKNINQRIVFGLPIVSVGRYRNLRKASPLMFKIIEISQSNYVLLFIIYKPKPKKDLIFYPDREINERVNWDLISIFVRNKQKIYPREV
ncbi:MAG: Cmr1-1 Cmr subunit domain-containing protein, partial [candidate division WOR-3 bacterium]